MLYLEERTRQTKPKCTPRCQGGTPSHGKAKAKAKRTVAFEATTEGIAAAAGRAVSEQDETVATESECSELEETQCRRS